MTPYSYEMIQNDTIQAQCKKSHNSRLRSVDGKTGEGQSLLKYMQEAKGSFELETWQLYTAPAQKMHTSYPSKKLLYAKYNYCIFSDSCYI